MTAAAKRSNISSISIASPDGGPNRDTRSLSHLRATPTYLRVAGNREYTLYLHRTSMAALTPPNHLPNFASITHDRTPTAKPAKRCPKKKRKEKKSRH